MNIGIICEYNPFHYGHLYHLNKIKEMYPNSNVILVMSGWLCERGDLSIIDKFKKTDIAIHYGVDLVIELPIKYMQSADYFASGALNILNKFNVEKIVFGSESNDIKKLTNIAKVQINNKEFDNKVKEYASAGINYPTALSKAIEEKLGFTINTPNDLLGISYIKEILKNNYKIEPITIKRENDYNSKIIQGKITSSTSIRELLKRKKSVKKYIPKYAQKYINNPLFIDDYFSFLKYKILTENDLTKYNGISKDIENRINNFINNSNTFEELINNIKSKRYTYNRIKRLLTFILFSITKDEFKNQNLEYIRILGFNLNGKKILNKIKKNINIPIITNYCDEYLYLDYKINKILSLNNKIKNKKEFIEKEYKNKPIIK